MSTKEDLLQQFAQWNQFVVNIQGLNWEVPLNQGKWTIHDLVSHIMLWDEYFLENAIQPISQDVPLTLRHLDYDKFNLDAMVYGRTLSKKELIQRTIDCRNRILLEIKDYSEDRFTREYVDGDNRPFSVDFYVKDFISHDRHHMKQIEERKDLFAQT